MSFESSLAAWRHSASMTCRAPFAFGHSGVAIATAVLVIITLFYAVFTYGLLAENRLLRRAGTQPSIVIYLRSDEHDITVIDAVIANVGTGPAFNVSISVKGATDGLKRYRFAGVGSVTEVPLSVMPAGEVFRMMVGTAFDIAAEPTPKPITARASFTGIDGRQFTTASNLDIREPMSVIRAQDRVAEGSLKALKEISTTLSRWSAAAIASSHNASR